ncbi:THAP domain-containing protein 4 [Eurytemora carolleeae]|uniref:THAP domain-containing protein 4 n=1 Tax=Eurytemora carolleeae TaxID=1294199 RepID=UPI000C75D77D|nr:THAP domain-containing protein 4 [Eurytemora carolleeae]|eukprot:XP_023342167.1 THAP domain-containing protein 4-like [Eurytemora affinis]
MNPDAPDVLTPLYWLAGTWKSKDFGQGTYPTIKDFQYKDELVISCTGQPLLDFSSRTFHAVSNKMMHRETGFIKIKDKLGRIEFTKSPHVTKIQRKLRLLDTGELEQTVFMATENTPLTQHLQVTYTKQ